jgi:hypothetical protein
MWGTEKYIISVDVVITGRLSKNLGSILGCNSFHIQKTAAIIGAVHI